MGWFKKWFGMSVCPTSEPTNKPPEKTAQEKAYETVLDVVRNGEIIGVNPSAAGIPNIRLEKDGMEVYVGYFSHSHGIHELKVGKPNPHTFTSFNEISFSNAENCVIARTAQVRVDKHSAELVAKTTQKFVKGFE